MNPKIFILNCFPRQGKDYLARWLWLNEGFTNRQFKDKLFDIALEVSGIGDNEWFSRYETNDKELPWDKLGGLSQRQFLIKISEEWVKPVFGKDYFGKSLCQQIKSEVKRGDMHFAISDGGFVEETQILADEFGYDNVFVCQWNKSNPEAFKNDSRSWIEGFQTIILPDNNFKFDWTEQCWGVLKGYV